MSISTADFNALLLDPQYDAIGVAARIVPVVGDPVDVTVIDQTDGTTVAAGSQFQLETILPVVCVRKAELAANLLGLADLAAGQVVMDRGTSTEKTWRIKAPREHGGEVQIVLLDPAA